MFKDIPCNTTTKITINKLQITVNFAAEQNVIAENSVRELLLKKLFKEGRNCETCKNTIP